MVDVATEGVPRTRRPGAPEAAAPRKTTPATPARPPASRHGRVPTAGIVTIGMFFVAGSALIFGPTSADPDFVADLVSTVASGLAFLCCVHCARVTSGTARRSWALFATTMGMWAAADTIWFVFSAATGQHPLVSVADWLYLLGILPVAAGMITFPAGTFERGARSRLVLDVLVLGSALLTSSQLLVLDEVSALNPSTWDTVVYEIYPVTDVLLAALAVLLLIRTAGRPRLDLTLVALGFATWTATDNGYALFSSRGDDYNGSLVAIGYVLAPLLIGLGALVSPGSSSHQRTIQRHATGTVSAMLPDLAVLTAVGLVLVRGLGSWQDWAMAGVTLLLTAVRQLVLSSDNHTIRMELEGKVEQRTHELHQLSERHRSILEAVGEGIVGVDETGRIVFVNGAAADMLGWQAAELEGRQACATLCRDQHDECVIDVVMSVGEVVSHAETQYVRRNGHTFPVEITAAPKAGPSGTTGVVIAFRDVTERQAMDRMKREFVGVVSHELRTPLTAIRGSLEMLADGDTGELPERAQSVVEMAVRGSERLTRLVNDILDVERLDAGSFDVRPTPQDVAPLVATTIDSLRPWAHEQGVTLVADVVSGRAMCDADRLTQALTNLLGNAVKFTAPGKVVELVAEPRGNDVLFSIRDEGRGIPPEQLESIFDRFHQVDDGDARDKGGTGLGLTISKSIVERHGGHIVVESTLGVGSTFRFSLPAAG
jgi:PAS domain S-box-containing protein